MPKVGGDVSHVEDATRLVPDKRATHYWDDPGVTVRSYTSVLALSEDAWDIYMVYGPDTRWDGMLPPRPHFWMHQLGTKNRPRVDGPYFDGRAFAGEVAKLLPGGGAPP